MLRYEFFSHLIPSVIYLTIISLFKIGHFNIVDYLMLWLGGLIGTYFIDIDHVIFCLFSRPDKPCSLKVQEWLRKKDYRNALLSMVNTHLEHTEMIFHNAVFLPIFFVFCLFIVTSSGSIFTSSLVLAMYLHLLKDIWEMVKASKNYQLDFLFWQIKSSFDESLKKYFVWVATLLFFLLTGLFLR